MKVGSRLLPLQILGKQAANTAYKAKACERMLVLESENGVAQERIRSLMSDMGTESGLWALPSFDDPAKKYFPFVLPLADIDHGLHHCMEETEFAYNHTTWSTYFKQLNGLAKLFARRETVDRFIKFQIWENTRIPGEAKQSLASMFKTTCPSLCPHRWMYEFEVLHWLCERESFFKYLEPNILSGDSDLSQDEGNALKRLIEDPTASARFWGMAWVELQLHRWGFGVYDWAHRCPCHTKAENKLLKPPCPWNGRRLMEISAGKLQACFFFVGSLVILVVVDVETYLTFPVLVQSAYVCHQTALVRCSTTTCWRCDWMLFSRDCGCVG